MTPDTDGSADVESIDGVGPETAEKLRDEGIETVADLHGAERSDLYDVGGVGAATASELVSLVGDAPEDEGTVSDETSGDEPENRSDDEPGETGVADDEASPETAGLMTVRNKAIDVAPDLTGRDLDGIIEVTNSGEGWVAVVETIERKSVPDTQDILGRYEIEFTDDGTVAGYRRVNRYRRTESNPDEL
ncbi:gas vesicle protein GvpO [Halorubrum sp. Eb13]|uniref:gas vesicle protein GvpO n=1 Tax=Halorubrum sp. Eb13 TaxID=1383843 RepID=UPI000B98DE11|nr:gas vesicle protein GvpO [Halorubrum sp. Eb13]OYR40995.1 hypothetical protein DJ75_14555 [Halorubrum sp. Eb13]